MNLLIKLGTLLRGGSREALETVVDANAVRILEQEVRDYEQSLLQSKRELTQLVAERLRLQRDAERQQRRIAEREQQLAAVLAEDREAEAEVDALAQWVADEEPALQRLQGLADELGREEARLTEQLRAAGRELEGYQRELRLIKAQQSGQQVSIRLARPKASANVVREELEQSLQRLRQRQQDARQWDEAARTLDETLSADPLAALDHAEQARQRRQAKEAIIARAKLQGAPVRPA